MHKSPLMQYWGMPWKTPALSRNGTCYWVWWFYLPSATTSSKRTFMAATSCFLCKSSSYVCGRIYLWAVRTSHSFLQVSPRSPAVTHQFLPLHQLLWVSPFVGYFSPPKFSMQGAYVWSMVYCFHHQKKICKRLSHDLDWILSRGSQVLTLYGKPQYSVLLTLGEISSVVYFFQSSAMIWKDKTKGRSLENWCIISIFENLPW